MSHFLDHLVSTMLCDAIQFSDFSLFSDCCFECVPDSPLVSVLLDRSLDGSHATGETAAG